MRLTKINFALSNPKKEWLLTTDDLDPTESVSKSIIMVTSARDAAGKTTLSEEICSNVQHYIDEWTVKNPDSVDIGWNRT